MDNVIDFLEQKRKRRNKRRSKEEKIKLALAKWGNLGRTDAVKRLKSWLKKDKENDKTDPD